MPDYIFITCPDTAQPVKTGFRAERGADLSNLQNLKLRNCPACGKEHDWNGAMGFWVEEPADPSFWAGVQRIWAGPRRRAP
jgi:hypothetical protein